MLDDLFLLGNKFGIEDFEYKQDTCIIEVIVKLPTESIEIVLKRLRSKECGIGERIRLLWILGNAADKLSKVAKQ